MSSAPKALDKREPRRTETKTVTPKIAEALLAKNVNNYRKPILTHVAHLGKQMTLGEWFEDTGESIKLDWNGELIDGQQRLMAIVYSGVPVKFRIEYGLDPRAAEHIDHSRKGRTYANTLARRGETYVLALESALRLLYAYLRKCMLSTSACRPTEGELEILLAEFPDIRLHLNKGTSLRWIKHNRVKILAYYLFHKVDTIAATEFFRKIEDGDVAKDEPEWAFRKFMLEGLGSRNNLGFIETFALLSKAFIARREGRPVKVLKWIRLGTSREEFPYLDGLPYVDESPAAE